ncbi:MAG: hypothetical protein TYPL_0280 [Candidatus Tyloplasma litorale]|nr:MAG: hypothetical protein TYPL_0280 [Mycoplasmatales bacterium]
MKKVIIIDGNSLAYSRVPDSDKISTNSMWSSIDKRDIFIVRKFIKKILNFKFQNFVGYEIVIIFDEQNKHTFRHNIYKKYKCKSTSEKRREQKDYVYKQIEEIKKILKKINIPYYSSPYWEADDIIGMLVNKYEKNNYLITIVSGDKDILQLISDKTRVNFLKTNGKSILANRKNIWEITGGLWPDQIIQIKMLIGDSSDNIKGIGLLREGKVDYWRTNEAIEHIQKWNNIDNMIQNINKIKEPYLQSLLRGKDKLFLNKKLVTIIKDWKIDIDFEYFLNNELDIAAIIETINDLNLNNLTKNKKFKANLLRK